MPSYNSIILHEIGHAIGLQHEHQNPFTKIEWNKLEVYRFFPRWLPESVDKNVIQPAARLDESFGTYIDRESLMVYELPSRCFKGPETLK